MELADTRGITESKQVTACCQTDSDGNQTQLHTSANRMRQNDPKRHREGSGAQNKIKPKRRRCPG